MNIILFDASELKKHIPLDDPRIVHMTKILGLKEGDGFTAGIIGGKRGKAVLETKFGDGWSIQFHPTEDAPLPHPITIILGCPRPPVARRIIRDLTAMGVTEIRFCSTNLSEKSYLSSKLWSEGLWKKALIEGGMQGGATHLASINTYTHLSHALANLPEGDSILRIALDNGSASSRLPRTALHADCAILAIGPERGWSNEERSILQAQDFRLTCLGDRILRTETACSVGVGLILSKLGIY